MVGARQFVQLHQLSDQKEQTAVSVMFIYFVFQILWALAAVRETSCSLFHASLVPTKDSKPRSKLH